MLLALLLAAGLIACSGGDDPPAVSAPPADSTPATVSSPASDDAADAKGAEDTDNASETAAEPPAVAPTAPPTQSAETGVEAETANDGAAAAPQQHVVKGVVTQWAPMVLFVQPGDQIVFRQMTGHDTQTIDGMIPANATPWQSRLGEEGYAVTLTEPGAYIYKCNPHVSLGMIGAIIVGDAPPHNLDQIEAHPENKGMIGRAVRKLKQALAAQEGQ